MTISRPHTALVLGLVLAGCAEPVSAEAPPSSELLSGLWICDSEHEFDGTRILMSGHSYYSDDGRYEGTGLGIVMYEREADQIRWMATSSGAYGMDNAHLIYEINEVRATPLPVIGYNDLSDAEKIEMAAEFASMIDDQNIQSRNTVLHLSSTELITQSQDEGGELGVVTKCRKFAEVKP